MGVLKLYSLCTHVCTAKDGVFACALVSHPGLFANDGLPATPWYPALYAALAIGSLLWLLLMVYWADCRLLLRIGGLTSLPDPSPSPMWRIHTSGRASVSLGVDLCCHTPPCPRFCKIVVPVQDHTPPPPVSNEHFRRTVFLRTQ